MSYNIDTFKIKELINFSLPVKALYKHERSDWHPDRIDNDDGTVTFEIMETKLEGTIKDEIFYMTDISCKGEGSGTTTHWILDPAFKESKGKLVASRVWEGGDDIDIMTVKDGKLSTKNIEI